jgi:putative colanic acid biosynthesis UDP-glucose lipid carrier transferase
MAMRGAGAGPAGTIGRNRAETIQLLHDAMPLADMLAGTLFGYASVRIYFVLAAQLPGPAVIGTSIWRELVLASVIAALVVRRPDPDFPTRPVNVAGELRGVLQRAGYAGLILIWAAVITGTLGDMARLWIAIWAGFFAGWLCASRMALLLYRRRLAMCGGLRERIAVIGSGEALAGLIERLRTETEIVAVLERPSGDAAAVARALRHVVALTRDGAIGLVVLAVAPGDLDVAGMIVDLLKGVPVQVAVCAGLDGLGMEPAGTRMIAGVPMIVVADRPLDGHDLAAKLVVDKLGATLLLVLAVPMLMAVTLAILLETPGPVLFRQSRTGRGGRLFTVYKFRTMWHAAHARDGQQTMRGDPRCTRVGAFLRSTSIDELPQLWNVLRGDMSLVGPRPHAEGLHVRERSFCACAQYVQRQRVKPGLTGWAQIHGLRGAADTPEKLRRRVELDLYYVEHWSIWLDLKIIAHTPRAVLSAENAF